MRTLNAQSRNLSSTVGKIVMAVACALMIGGTFIAPAFADDNGRREGYQHGKYKYKRSRHVYQQPPRRYYYEPPPPVVYYPEPYQSPGISIVFPLR